MTDFDDDAPRRGRGLFRRRSTKGAIRSGGTALAESDTIDLTAAESRGRPRPTLTWDDLGDGNNIWEDEPVEAPRRSSPGRSRSRRTADMFDADPWADGGSTGYGTRPSAPASQDVDAWLQSDAEHFEDVRRDSTGRWANPDYVAAPLDDEPVEIARQQRGRSRRRVIGGRPDPVAEMPVEDDDSFVGPDLGRQRLLDEADLTDVPAADAVIDLTGERQVLDEQTVASVDIDTGDASSEVLADEGAFGLAAAETTDATAAAADAEVRYRPFEAKFSEGDALTASSGTEAEFAADPHSPVPSPGSTWPEDTGEFSLSDIANAGAIDADEASTEAALLDDSTTSAPTTDVEEPVEDADAVFRPGTFANIADIAEETGQQTLIPNEDDDLWPLPEDATTSVDNSDSAVDSDSATVVDADETGTEPVDEESLAWQRELEEAQSAADETSIAVPDAETEPEVALVPALAALTAAPGLSVAAGTVGVGLAVVGAAAQLLAVGHGAASPDAVGDVNYDIAHRLGSGFASLGPLPGLLFALAALLTTIPMLIGARDKRRQPASAGSALGVCILGSIVAVVGAWLAFRSDVHALDAARGTIANWEWLRSGATLALGAGLGVIGLLASLVGLRNSAD